MATDTAKRKVEKAAEFWTRKEAVATAFEAGEDAVSVAIASVTAADEPVVES